MFYLPYICLYSNLTMRKNPKTLTARAKYVQETINRRHKSRSSEDVVKDLAKELFLSESIIWKDYAKNLKNE